MNQVGQDQLAVAVEEIRIRVAAAESFLAAEDGEAAFENLRTIQSIAERTINQVIVDRLITSRT